MHINGHNAHHRENSRLNEGVAEALAELRQAEGKLERAKEVLLQAEEEVAKASEELEKTEHELRNNVLVSVSTTSGFWPTDGFTSIPIDQPIEVFLHGAKRELEIHDVTGWVARIGDRILNVGQSYRANGLTIGSEVVVDWGPDHGGGGLHA